MSASSQRINLNLDAAGEYRIDWAFEYLHVVRFEDSAGVVTLDGEILISLNGADDDFVPLLTNNKVRDKCDRGRLRWAAQPGRRAVILIADRAENFGLDTPNPKQLVTSALGTALRTVATTVNTAATIVSNIANRQSVILRNDGTTDCFIGGATVTATGTTKGIILQAGGTMTLDKQTAAVYAICASGSTSVIALEEFS